MMSVLELSDYRDRSIATEPECTDGRQFGSLAPRILANGYSIVPIIPGTKWLPRTDTDWRRFCWQRMIPEEVRVYRQLYAEHGLGLACGFHTVSVDIDANDQFLVRELISAAEQAFSTTPLVRGGRGSGVNMIYACSGPTITYMLPWLEILGVGRYVVAYGNHPDTGQPYRWIRGYSPIDIPAWDLPRITQASIDMYVKTIAPMLGVNYADIGLDIGQEHSEWMLSSRTQLVKQLALAILRGKAAAKMRARKVLADGVFHVPTLRVREGSTKMQVRRQRP